MKNVINLKLVKFWLFLCIYTLNYFVQFISFISPFSNLMFVTKKQNNTIHYIYIYIYINLNLDNNIMIKDITGRIRNFEKLVDFSQVGHAYWTRHVITIWHVVSLFPWHVSVLAMSSVSITRFFCHHHPRESHKFWSCIHFLGLYDF